MHDALEDRKEIWMIHELEPLQLPSDASSWDNLPDVNVNLKFDLVPYCCKQTCW